MNEILKKLEGIITPEQVSALSVSMATMVEEQATIRANKIVEEQVSDIKALALKAGERFYNDKLEKMKVHMSQMVEEQVEAERKKMAHSLQVIEESLVKDIAQVVEESVSSAIPNDIALTIASARSVLKIVEETKQVFETNFVSLDTDGKTAVESIRKEKLIAEEEFSSKLAVVEESLSSVKAENARLVRESNTLKAKNIIDNACRGLAEESRQAVYTMMHGKSLSSIEASIKSAVSIVEEQFIGKSVNITETDKEGSQTSVARATGIVEEGLSPSNQSVKPIEKPTHSSIMDEYF